MLYTEVLVMDEFALTNMGLQKLQTVAALEACNDITARYGLRLRKTQIQNLAEKRFEALRDTGRVEFGEGILRKLVTEFCDSPFLMQESYEDTLAELQDIFYYFKNESMDRYSDDELIAFMRSGYDESEGALDYLSGTSLEALCRIARGCYEETEEDDSDDFDLYD